MNDQFLHKLRREPRAEFATRLKWQLDRPVPTRPRGGRWVLGLAIFGTAFALVSPPARHTFHALFESATNDAPVAADTTRGNAPRLVSSSGPSAGRSNPTPNVRSVQFEPATPLARAPELASTQPLADSLVSAKAAGAVGDAVAPVSITGLNGLTPQMQAERAILLRQGLFRVMTWVMLPLNAMRHGQAPVDMKAMAAGADRLQQLSSMTPEVFQQDTRALDVDTRALSTIWNEPADFGSKVDDLTSAAESLARAAASSDEVAAAKAIDRIENACTACHHVYRSN
jgi:cytochrome c556